MATTNARRVAIVGCAFRFPSTDLAHYWSDLLAGKDLVSAVAPGRWSDEAFLHPEKSSPGTAYTFAAGSLGDVSGFDASFFGISPREAAQMDPQQRLLLELAWEAFEDAGIRPGSLRGSDCGVYMGVASTDYSMRLTGDLAAIDSSVATGTTGSIAANRLSYFFDLRGPSMAIDTACSSSLVAFHQACRAIAAGEVGHALAGGISLHLHPYGFIIFSKASMLSRRGRCRAFDADGDGYVRSEGGGVFLLKDYDAAVAAGDRILAVVAHTHTNTDGHKSGLTVPSTEAQADLLERVYREAGIAPEDIHYIEAHGTGTAVGDPVEAQALGAALGRKRPAGKALPIGSVKSNLGHLEAAAGVAGVVKAVYALRHRIVPATIGISNLRPDIPFTELNLDVVTENRPLPAQGRLTMGVNSFGFGGANAHVILQSAPEPAPRASAQADGLTMPLLISAASPAALRALAASHAADLAQRPAHELYDIAYHAFHRREQLPHRAVVWANAPAAMAQALESYARGEDAPSVQSGAVGDERGAPAFVYSGNGSQWQGMGRELLKDPVFHAAVRKVDAIFRNYAQYSLEAELAGENGSGRYEYTEIAQPALFALQVGITEMLRSLGVRPAAVVGHSVGEVAAAWACGALTLEDAVCVIFHRSRLQGGTKGRGQMTAVALSAETAARMLQETGHATSLSIAGVNSPRGITLAGDVEHLADFEAALLERGVTYKRLNLDYAFHSPAMDGIAGGVMNALAGILPRASNVPYYSTVSGERESGETLGDIYWWYNVRKPVLFDAAVSRMADDGLRSFVEIGPHPVLRAYVADTLKARSHAARVVPTLSRDRGEAQRIFCAAGEMMIAGLQCDWSRIFPVVGRHMDLPRYPWQREAHWHASTSESLGLLERRKAHPLLGYRLPQLTWTWENRIDLALQTVLADHVVGAETVFPGTAYAELVLAAAQEWKPNARLRIEALDIRVPLVLSPDDGRVLRLGIGPADGGFSIKARAHAGDGEWTLHACGRILEETGQSPSVPTHMLPDRPMDFNGDDHVRLTRSVGLAYGPAFRALEGGWIDGDVVHARFAMPEALSADLDAYLLHPALLDCAFQLIIHMRGGDVGAEQAHLFVPTRIGCIRLARNAGLPHRVHAQLLKRSPHSILADFTLFDELGQFVARIDNVRFRSMRVQHARGARLNHLVHHATPCPLGRHGGTGLPFEFARQVMKDAVRHIVMKGVYHRYTEEIDPLLDELCSRYVLETFEALVGGDWSRLPERLAEIRGRAEHNAPYLDYLLSLAEADGLLQRSDGVWRLCEAPDESASAQDIWHTLISDYPDYFRIIHATGRVGMRLPALLSDRACAPIAASPGMLGRQILTEGGRSQIGRGLRRLAESGLRQLPAGQRFRVMEIDSGVPAYAADICAALDFDRADFSIVTDSQAALDELQNLRCRYPDLQAHLMQDRNESDRGMHLVVVSLDFISASQAHQALQLAREALAPNGTLIMLGHHPARWMDFVFGMHPEWWQASDGILQSQQLSALAWQFHLEQAGLENIQLFEFSPDTRGSAYLLMAHEPVREDFGAPILHATARHWLLLADDVGESRQLARAIAARLEETGDRASLIERPDSETVEAALRAARERFGRVDGIAHLAGLDVSSSPLEVQTYRCALLAATMKACESLHIDAPLWVFTQAAMHGVLPKPSPSVPSDAAIWGFTRTLINEAVGRRVRLVDLESMKPADALLQAVLHEFEQPDEEDEILLGADGARYAVRIQMRREDDDASADKPAFRVHRLAMEAPGQLRNLRWESHEWRRPGPGEIEVEVRATGLNFRDVMYTLGLLADEAIEDGFAGPTLGLEFAGTVLSVGEGVSAYAPGDAVMGFGPASFSTRVMTSAEVIAPIPAGMSHAAASTIPSAFFTAYYALHHQARLSEGESVLIHGAAGGVGLAAIQIAQWCGARIYVTAGADEKRDFLRLLGIRHILDSRSLTFADDILALTEGKGVDVVLNSIAGEAINRNLGILKPFGRFVELGKRDFYENTRIGLRPFRNNITYFGIDADQLMQVRPELSRKLYTEVMALFSDGVLHPLPYQAFEADDCVDAFRFMQQAKQIGKVVVTYHNGVSAMPLPAQSGTEALSLSADASYLVTGGLSGFGLRTAQWLADKGARNLVLLSRSGATDESGREILEDLEARGVRVIARACDVTDKDAVTATMREIADRMPPLKGVIHAAMVVQDGLIRNLSAEQIHAVLAPKLLGALHLHEATRALPLDFFVLYSSATAIFGNPGQASYVAANLWLDAFARYRRAQGLAATSVLWGAIEDAGFFARNEQHKDAMQNRMGGTGLSAEAALAVLETVLLGGRSGEAVVDLDWTALKRFLASAQAPKFSRLAGQSTDAEGGDDKTPDIQQMLMLPEPELLSGFVDILRQQLGEVLRVPAARIDPARSLNEMGLDSLMGVELIMALEAQFSVRLPIMALSEYPTVTKLAERLIAILRNAETKTADALPSRVRQVVEQHTTELSAVQKEALSAQILGDLDRQTRRMIH